MKGLKLDRPLAVFDIESTGVNRKTDRIIDLAIVRLPPAGQAEDFMFRVNPGMPIPPAATAVHGIHDADVKDCPFFKDKAQEILAVLDGCDLAGYNILGYDIPLLCEEFERVGLTFPMEGRRVLDAQRIYHQKEPRDLTAALAFYCGEMHLEAHAALGDVKATLRVIEGQFKRYRDLPQDLNALDAYCNPRDPTWVDRSGRLKWQDGEVVLNFGRHQGKRLRDMVAKDPGFVHWMLKNDFPRDTQEILRKALEGVYPPPVDLPPVT